MTTTSLRALRCACVTLLLFLWAGSAAAQLSAGGPHLAMRLVAESARPRAGTDVTVGIDTRPQPGWHGYWRNPGDAGFPAKLGWTLPAGVTVGEPAWPVPTTLTVAGLMNYVYETPYAPLLTVSVPAGLPVGTSLPLVLRADYLVCTTSLCVPESQTLSLTLTVGDGAPGPQAARFAAWRRAIPRPLDATASYQVDGGELRVAVPYPASAVVDVPYLFATGAGAIDYASPQSVTRDGDRLVIVTRPAAARPTGRVDAVLRIRPGKGLAIHAVPGAVPPVRQADGWAAAVAAFAGAVLGGLILNVMPCVFPILSIKALSLARGGESAGAARREALAYTAGVVGVCVALGAVILGLRAGGSAVGWAFQLQDPRVVLLLLVLCVGITLNLLGVFELPTPRFAGSSGTGSAFATGALAAFVATPCSGPFMGAALGAALVLPAAGALAVFAGLGLGLAVPFLLIGFVPGLRRRLPRPGAWMVTFRRILAVPMAVTAAALVWLLDRQAGTTGLGIAIAVVAVAAALLWAGGRRQASGRGFGGAAAGALAVASLAGAATLAGVRAPPRAASSETPFSEARLAALRAKGRPVFVYFTADWCLTCKVNERAAIGTAGVRQAFARGKVAVLEGDWTDGDQTLGRFIEAHNRAGVPLYLFYPAGGAEPRVLPQVLTPGMLEALAS